MVSKIKGNIPFALAAVGGLVFVGIGFAVSILFAPTDDRDAILNNVIKTQADYDALAVGSEMVVFGTLDRNDLVEPMFEAVAFSRQELTYDEDDEGIAEYSWATVTKDIPGLNIQLVDGAVRTQPVDSNAVRIRGAAYTLEEWTPGNYNYDGQRIDEGATRRQVVTDGDMVTVVGVKSSDGFVEVSQFYVGEPSGLLRELNQEIAGLRIFGLIMGGVGLIISIAMTIAVFAGSKPSS